ATVLNQLVGTVRHTGGIGVVGLYLPSDPGAPDEHSAKGELLVRIGRLFEKGQTLGTGQAGAKRYAQRLRDHLHAGRAQPGLGASQELPLTDAPDAYARFDRREEGYSKVVLHPGSD